MIIQTRDFGEMEIKEENIITFKDGIFGFEETKSYVLVTPLGEDKYPVWLQSIHGESPCFILYSPFEIVLDYNPAIEGLPKLKGNPDFLVLSLAVIVDELSESTVNLRCPVVINKSSREAAQYILEQPYPMKYYLFEG